MSVLQHKDVNLLEEVRLLGEDDLGYYSVLNRPLEDLEERTTDLVRIMYPAVGLRVRQTAVPSTSVVVCIGSLMTGLNLPTYFPESGVTTTIPILPSAAGFVRVDLIYLDLETREPVHVVGTEVAPDAVPPSAHPYVSAWALRGSVADGSTDGMIPLAFIFVDEYVTTVYDETVPAYTGGAIMDARPGPGMARWRYANNPAQLLEDLDGGSVAGDHYTPRVDHVHPAHVDATLPTNIRENSVAAYGTPVVPYARSDHAHNVVGGVKAASGFFPPPDIMPDTPIASVGTEHTLMRVDHQHGLNITATLPADCTVGVAGSVGVSPYYIAQDHRHLARNVRLKCVSHRFAWLSSSLAQNFPIPFTPLFAIFFQHGWYTTSHNESYYSMGMYSIYDMTGGATGMGEMQGSGYDEGGARWSGEPSDIIGGTAPSGGGGGGKQMTYYNTVTTFSKAAGLTLTPNVTWNRTWVDAFIFGQEE